MKILLNLFWVVVLQFTVVGCGGITSDLFGSSEAARPFLVHGRAFNLNVRYEQTAAPFTGSFSNGRRIWSLTSTNLRAALPNSISSISVTSDLSQMVQLRSFGITSWSKERLKGMAFESSFAKSGLANNTITAVFLRGRYVENTRAMGIHFHGSAVVFIFKDVVESLGTSQDQMASAEQSTIIHEVGHAIGLVNSFVPMTWGAHEDPANKNHCTNPNCVMYKRSDGLPALEKVRNTNPQGTLNLFGPECLHDLNNFYNDATFN